MMRRFSRKRRSSGGERRPTIDAAAALAKILETGVIEAKRLEPAQPDDVPGSVAAIGRGERADGSEILVSYSPTSATEALLGALSAAGASGGADSGFSGIVYVVAPQWPAGARRILSQLGATAFTLEALAAAQLADGRVVVEPEPEAPILATGSPQLGARMASAESRVAFSRAAAALDGLAAKHGGTVRAGADRLELVILARRAAVIRADGDHAVLETQLGGRQSTPLAGADLAGAFDALEGQIRRRVGDRKVRDGEEGLRGRVVAQLAAGDELRGLRAWPQPGVDLDPIDAVAVNAAGEPVVVAVREEVNWPALAAVLESIAPLAALFPVLFAEVGPPLRLGPPRLLLVGERFSEGLERALGSLTIAYELRAVGKASGRSVALTERASGEGAEARPARRGRRRGGRNRGAAGEGRDRVEAAEPGSSEAAAEAVETRMATPSGPRADREAQEAGTDSGTEAETGAEDTGRSRGRRRRRSRRGRGGSAETVDGDRAAASDAAKNESGGSRGSEADADVEDAETSAEIGRAPRRSRRFEEISLMDLDDDGPPRADAESEESEGGGGRSRRGRRRGRRSANKTDDRAASKDKVEAASAEEEASTAPVEEDDLVDSDDLEEILARLADDVPDLDSTETPLTYEDEEDDDDDSSDSQRLDREKRRRERKGSGDDDDRPAQRRRSAIVVHADRDALVSALLLARDIRQIDGLWIYPQSELMTFFRSVATDLRDDTPIILVGFSPSPARDVVQASSLYRGRLTWFDRQPWPPEDLMALRDALGHEAIHAGEEIDSCLPLVLETTSRRSRFSDKLVDLATGRFTQHDFERWGRLWWHRLGEIAKKSGDIRADIAPILAGRPSDLTKEAALIEVPPAPAEVDYVASTEFRLVHFGGHIMVVVPVEEGYDLHLSARIARERYAATLSLAYRIGGETFAFGGDELIGKRALDYPAVVEHLVNKLEWIDARPDADHVARFHVRDFAQHPERLEEVMGEIAMGRALLER